MAKDRRRAALSAVALTVIAVAAAFWSLAPVLAHARYKSSTPAKGEIVPISPSAVEITFTNDIQKVAGTYDLQVNKDRGPSVTSGSATVNDDDRSKLSVALQPELTPGRYVVNWTNVSDEDGDPAEGAFSFYIADYTPTTVDLANDAQLELVGAEEGETPSTGDTPVSSGDTPSSAPTSVRTSGATSTATSGAEAGDDGDDGDGNGTLIVIVVVAVAAGAVAAVGGFLLTRRRS